jgi:hypothetical protein
LLRHNNTIDKNTAIDKEGLGIHGCGYLVS